MEDSPFLKVLDGFMISETEYLFLVNGFHLIR